MSAQPTISESTHAHPSTWAALWRSAIRIDRSKVNRLPIAFRNSVAVAVPLAAGIALGNSLAGVAVATGALNVAYSDGTDPYAQRARRMLAWSFIGAIAVFTGSITRSNMLVATAITMLWAFVAGMQLAVSSRAGDLGLNTLVTLVVFSARGPSDPQGILWGTLLVLLGGLLQTSMALLFWPVNRHEPERRALASVYEELAHGIAAPSSSLLSAPLRSPSPEVQDTLNALGRDYSLEGERFRYLFDQVDRMRLSAFALQHAQGLSPDVESAELALEVQKLFSTASQLLLVVSQELAARKEDPALQIWTKNLQERLDALHRVAGERRPQSHSITAAVDVFAGQVRSVARMTGRTLPEQHEFQNRQAATPPTDQLKQWLEILKANLSLDSSTCRHAIRSAVCVGVADSISRAVSWQRSYWIPMTVAVILKPDFTTTLTRGLLRLLGTLVGLVVATVLYHAIPPSAISELFLVGLFTFALRVFGGANYGFFSVAISALIVFLIAETGVSPSEVVSLRGTNTLVGGLLALLAYLLWPTWERKRVSENFAEMIDATRTYFHSLMTALTDPKAYENVPLLEEAQQEWRLARSNAERSVDKVSSEPKFPGPALSCLNSMLASSRALAESIREMQAETYRMPVLQQSTALRLFSEHVEFTLYYLAAALRGSASASEALPQLREDHTHLVEERELLGAAQESVLLGTDRITTTLNTLREQTIRYLAHTSDTAGSSSA